MRQDVLLQVVVDMVRIPLRGVERLLHPIGRGFSR
jgi:hypothetical protein